MSDDRKRESETDVGSGASIDGSVDTGGGSFVGRDKHIHGDEVRQDKVVGDKVAGDKISTGDITGVGIAVGQRATAISIHDVPEFGGAIFTGDVSISSEPIAGRTVTNRQATGPPPDYTPRAAVETRLREMILVPSDTLKLVFLTGLPRSGVTTVAQSIAAQLEDEFPDGTLWTDLETTRVTDALWSFIEPYDQTLDRTTLRNKEQYLDTLRRLLADKRVLIVLDHVHTPAEVTAIAPVDCPRVVVLVVSRVGLPGMAKDASWVTLPEMSVEEAEELFRKIWAHDLWLRDTPADVIRELARAHHFMPADMVTAARDILTNQIPPQDYLEELHQRTRSMDAGERPYAPVFGAVYDRLPDLAQQLLPFTGVLGGGTWDMDALAAVAPLNRHGVEVGLRQLVGRIIVNQEPPDRYTIISIIRDFALAKLREMGGDALLWASRRVVADHFLREADRFIRRHHQALLSEFLQDEGRRTRFATALNEKVAVSETRTREAADAVLSKPGMEWVTFELMQETFEEVVFGEPSYRDRSAEVLESDTFRALRQHLEQALTWAIDREDWPLVRRFAGIGASPWIPLTVTGSRSTDKYGWIGLELSFGLIRQARLTNANLVTNFRATRIHHADCTDCDFLDANWQGVQLTQGNFNEVDMVGARMPGLYARECAFSDVDARGADFRGAIFQGCTFTDLNLRNANLDDAEFVACTLVDVDLRNVNIMRTKGLRVESS